MTSKRHFPHRHQEPQNRFRAAGEERSPRSGRSAYPCKATLKIQLVNVTLCSTKFSAMLHKNFCCRVLYWRMEILPKVDKAEPHWNDDHRGVKPLKLKNIEHSWSPGGGSSAAGEGGPWWVPVGSVCWGSWQETHGSPSGGFVFWDYRMNINHEEKCSFTAPPHHLFFLPCPSGSLFPPRALLE